MNNMEGDILRDDIRERVKSEQVKCNHNGKITMPCLIVQDGDMAMTEDKHCKGCGLHISSLSMFHRQQETP